MAEFDLTTIDERLRALPESAKEIERLYQAAYPGHITLSEDDRAKRREWLAEQLELPTQHYMRTEPRDKLAQDDWVMYFSFRNGHGVFEDIEEVIDLSADIYQALVQWLHIFGWWDANSPS